MRGRSIVSSSFQSYAAKHTCRIPSRPIVQRLSSLANTSSLPIQQVQTVNCQDSFQILLSSSNNEIERTRPVILSPDISSFPTTELSLSASSPVNDQIAESIEAHYTLDNDGSGNSQQFVGGMGESDGGVWFLSRETDSLDTLDYWESIQGK